MEPNLTIQQHSNGASSASGHRSGLAEFLPVVAGSRGGGGSREAAGGGGVIVPHLSPEEALRVVEENVPYDDINVLLDEDLPHLQVS